MSSPPLKMSITFFLAFVFWSFKCVSGANETHELSSPNATVASPSSPQEEKIYSFKSPDLSNFISRVKKVFDSEAPITCEDLEAFEKLELSGLLIGLTGVPTYRSGKTISIWNLPQASSSTKTDDDEFYWSEIRAFFLEIAPEWNLASVLEYAYEFKDIDELTRSQFYDYYKMLAFLKGNSHHLTIYHQMKDYEAVMNFVESEKMLSNSSLLFLASNISVNSKEISIRAPTLKHQNLTFMISIHRLLKELFKRLESQSDNFTLPSLKKISIYNLVLSTKVSFLLYKVLSHNSHTISILEIVNSGMRYIKEVQGFIQLTNLGVLRLISSDTFFNYLRFGTHSNYSVLDFAASPQMYRDFESGQLEYFRMTSKQEMNRDYLNFIRSNSNLRCVRIEVFTENFLPLRELLSDLPNLQVLFLRLSDEMQFQIATNQRFPGLKKLFIRGRSENFDWSMLKAFPALEYLNVDGSVIDKPGLVEAIKESKTIKSLVIGTYALSTDRSQLIKSISECRQSIKNLSLGIEYLESDHQIKSLSNSNFPCLFLDIKEFSSLQDYGHSLPSTMKAVRFLFVPNYDNAAFQRIKGNERFPNLEAIIFEKAQRSEEDSSHSKIRLFQQSDKAKVKAFFKQLGCLSFDSINFYDEWLSNQSS